MDKFSDERDEALRKVSLEEYLRLQARPNGNGVKGFIKSPLFAALVIFILTQSLLVGGVFISIYWKVNSYSDWKVGVDKTMEVFNKQGSPALRAEVEFHMREDATKWGELEARIKSIESDTKHFDVMEAEHLRLTKDVEALKNGKK